MYIHIKAVIAKSIPEAESLTKLTWQHPWPNNSVLLREDVVASHKFVVILILWVTEAIEAKLPQTHVVEVTVGVAVGLEPVGAEKVLLTLAS